MTGLFDRDVLEAALSACMSDTSRVPDLIAANGGELLDVGDLRSIHALLEHLAALHAAGEPFEPEIAASKIAESAGSDRAGCLALIHEIQRRSNPAAFPLFLARLRSLRFRRRIAESGERAQNGCADADLVADVMEAVRDGEADGEGLEFADLTAAPRPAPPALVGRAGQVMIPVGDKAAVVADSGTGKTHFLVALGLGISAGKKVLDFDCAQQPVAYFSSDDDQDLVRIMFQLRKTGRAAWRTSVAVVMPMSGPPGQRGKSARRTS